MAPRAGGAADVAFLPIEDTLAGSLNEAVNLTKLEWRPGAEGTSERTFFVDLEGDCADARVASALAGPRAEALTLQVLGSYPAAPG